MRLQRRTDESVLARPRLDVRSAHDVEDPDPGTERGADGAVRERVHAGVQPAIHDGEDVEDEQRDHEVVRDLRDPAVGVIRPLEEVIEEERDGHAVRRVRGRAAILEVVTAEGCIKTLEPRSVQIH